MWSVNGDRRPNEPRVFVTGIGAVTSLGQTWPATWRALLAGERGVAPITLFASDSLPVGIAAEVKDWDGSRLNRRDLRHLDRSVQFALAAAREAVRHAGLDVPLACPERFGVVVGSAVGGLSSIEQQARALAAGGYRKVSAHLLPNMLVDSAAAHIAIELGARGPNLAVVSACATGSNAIGEAAEIIRRRRADVVLTGGTDAPITPLFMAGFNVMRALAPSAGDPAAACKPFDRHRRGLVVGEGAGVLVLESEEHAQARGASVLAEVVGYGTSEDAHNMAAPDPQAAGMEAAIRSALSSAGLAPKDINYVSAHGTGTELNDRLETLAIKRALGARASQVPVSSIKGALGHTMGAAGAIEAAVCVQTIRKGVVPPTVNLQEPDPECDLDYVPGAARSVDVDVALSNSFGMGGHNATLIVARVC